MVAHINGELWRWVPDEVSLHLTRILNVIAPEIVAYACTSGSFVGGVAGVRTPGGPGHALHGVGDAGPEGVRGRGGRHGDRMRVHGPDAAHLEGPVWAALRRVGTRAVGPYQALPNESARAWQPQVLPEERQERSQEREEREQERAQEREGWT